MGNCKSVLCNCDSNLDLEAQNTKRKHSVDEEAPEEVLNMDKLVETQDMENDDTENRQNPDINSCERPDTSILSAVVKGYLSRKRLRHLKNNSKKPIMTVRGVNLYKEEDGQHQWVENFAIDSSIFYTGQMLNEIRDGIGIQN